jgi:hypothetical protein
MIRALALPLLVIAVAEGLLLLLNVAWERGWLPPRRPLSTNCAVPRLKGTYP